jgi:hypothetical protein
MPRMPLIVVPGRFFLLGVQWHPEDTALTRAAAFS